MQEQPAAVLVQAAHLRAPDKAAQAAVCKKG